MLVSHKVFQDSFLITYTVEGDQESVRLDQFLKKRYHRRSRQELKKVIRSGRVVIVRKEGNRLPVGKPKPSLQLMVGDEVQIQTQRGPEPEVDFNYRVLYEDNSIYVIDKPGLLPVHPAGRYYFHTLMTHLLTRGFTIPLHATQAEKEFYLVHRIDKETSGVLLLAKSKKTCADLIRQFVSRKTEKKYLAIVHGHPDSEFEVNLALNRKKNSPIALKMYPVPESEGGLKAYTSFKKLDQFGDYALLECHPQTGRQHQIRVHLQQAGYPIVGDKLYGLPDSEALQFFEKKSALVKDLPQTPSRSPFIHRRYLSAEILDKLKLKRHALHAAEISFTHPVTQRKVTFASPLPEDLKQFLEENREKRTFRKNEAFAKEANVSF